MALPFEGLAQAGWLSPGLDAIERRKAVRLLLASPATARSDECIFGRYRHALFHPETSTGPLFRRDRSCC